MNQIRGEGGGGAVILTLRKEWGAGRQKNFFSALRALVWCKHKGRGVGITGLLGPSPGSAIVVSAGAPELV